MVVQNPLFWGVSITLHVSHPCFNLHHFLLADGLLDMHDTTTQLS
jgi:hypothetical protein